MSFRYLLDTNILWDVVRRPSGIVATRIADVGEESICTSTPADQRYPEVRHHLATQGTPIGPNDLLIAEQLPSGSAGATTPGDEWRCRYGDDWLTSIAIHARRRI